jgi:hypothetical protein
MTCVFKTFEANAEVGVGVEKEKEENVANQRWGRLSLHP